MPMSEHEVAHFEEAFFSREPVPNGPNRPTLWDNDGPGRTRVVVLYDHSGQRIEIHSDPDVVACFLEQVDPTEDGDENHA